MFAAGLGHRRCASNPPLGFVCTGELQLLDLLLRLGSAFRNLHPADAGTTRPDSLWRPRIAAARLPETFRNASDPLATSARQGGVVRGTTRAWCFWARVILHRPHLAHEFLRRM